MCVSSYQPTIQMIAENAHTHTHTHTHIYIYIYICKSEFNPVGF